MSNQNGNPEALRRFFLHTPADVSQSYVHWAEQLQASPGITYGCVLDRHVIPLHPGDFMAIVARPGHGKSSFMAYMAKREALAIQKRGKQDEECVVYISWEQSIEEIDAFFQSGKDYSSSDLAWGRVPLETIKRKAIKRVHLPIWYVGNSHRHAAIKKPRLTIDNVYQVLEAMFYEYNIRPTLVCLDYMQIIPVKFGVKRIDAVTEATFQTKELALNLGIPIVAGVQANRDVDDQKYPIPSLASAQWASAIEQTADKQIALWRPRKTHHPDEHPSIPIGGLDYDNDEGLLVIKLLKQRFEKGYGVWAVKFKPQTLEVFDYETRRIDQ